MTWSNPSHFFYYLRFERIPSTQALTVAISSAETLVFCAQSPVAVNESAAVRTHNDKTVFLKFAIHYYYTTLARKNQGVGERFFGAEKIFLKEKH
jgi:hypothetical protein